MSNPLDFNDPFDSAHVPVCNVNESIRKEYGDAGRIANAMRGLQIGATRLLCLTQDERLAPEGDLLLWSHYADYGHGIRIGVDLEGPGYEILQMKYCLERPSMNIEGIRGDELYHTLARMQRDVYSIKGLAWSYENEVRVCAMLNVASPRVETSDTGDVFCIFPPSNYLYVDFGPKMSYESCMSAALTVLQREDLRHIKFRRAVVDQARFQYVYEPFDVLSAFVDYKMRADSLAERKGGAP